MSKRFVETPAPANYVAGLGRGATGFTTRSDIGPARMTPEEVSGAAAAAVAAAKPMDVEEKEDRYDYSDSNFDEFGGYSHSIFRASDPYEQDDKEADEIYDSVDERMDSRRRRRRELREQSEREKYRATRPKIQQSFADIKKELSKVSAEEWENLPEVGNLSHRGKRARPERYVPVPDSIVLDTASKERSTNTMPTLGFQTPLDGSTTVADLHEIGAARKTVLDLKLHQVSDSVSGQTVVDPKGYLTDLNSVTLGPGADVDIGDLQKARLLLKSVITTNPKHAPGWIAAARLEKMAGKLAAARKMIKKGCTACPENVDVWLEAASLHTPSDAKAILATAVRHVPHSVKLWLQAAHLEKDVKAKRRVLRKALEFIPNSVKLWKAAVELEHPDDARIMLSRAVECVPHSVTMWLALAKLETYENARRVLNKARETIPTDPRIWITAAKLEEANGNEDGVNNIIKRAVKSLSAHQVVIDREQWIKEAENAEHSGFPATCQAIVRETIGIGVEDVDRKDVWMEDAESCLAHGSVQTARAIYAHALTVYPGKKSIWLREAYLEKNHGTAESLDQLLKKAVAYCPRAEILWLMAAKEKWLTGDVDGARAVLAEAFRANPDSEQIWLAAVKLESANKEQDRARDLLSRARDRAGTERVWMKSAALEREIGNLDEAEKLLDEALKRYPQFDKLWMMRGQLEEQRAEENGANPTPLWEKGRAFYQRGLLNCPHSIPLWLCAAQLEEKISTAKARSLLEKARLKNPKTPDLWLAAIEAEERANNKKIAENLLAKALQECPTSGMLWAKAIAMEPRPKQKSKSVDALKRCDNDPHVIVAVARIFWQDRKVEKARNWFDRAVKLNPDLGDAWAAYYKFELQYGKAEKRHEQVLKRCRDADPHHGRVWCSVAKRVGNAAATTEDVLKQVAALV
ncbi:Pre-mRNA-processing factor 6 [Balamuthia mandrillaris]